MKSFRLHGRSLILFPALLVALLAGATPGLLGSCGPFGDFTDPAFCPHVLEIFFLGITTGTTPTTYDPASAVSRLQMAAFLSRSVDAELKRGSRRAALDQFWTVQNDAVLTSTTVGVNPLYPKSDGLDVWVPNGLSDSVSRVRAADGRLLETWTGATSAYAVLVAFGRVFVTGFANPGRLYRIDPSQPAGAVTTVASTLGGTTRGIAFDGARIWTANGSASVSIITPGAAIPWTVTTVTTGFVHPINLVFDGASMWATDFSRHALLRLDPSGAVLQTVTVGDDPENPAFDGTNIWVPNLNSQSVSVVRAATGAVLMELLGNGLYHPTAAAFDGQRILVTNYDSHTVSLWKAADLTPLGVFPTGPGTTPLGACSDGVNFWITLYSAGRLARF